MNITASLVKELRERTGAGMMDCKKALSDTKGDIEAAIEVMRKSGAAKAAKKAGRIAAEGIISIKQNESDLVVLEVNCETDFVTKDENFLSFVETIIEAIINHDIDDVNDLHKFNIGNQTIEEMCQQLIAKIGEKITIRRFEKRVFKNQVGLYLHGTRIGVVAEIEGGNEELAKDIAMHIAASKPLYIDENNVAEEILDKEREIYMAQAQESGKPAEIIEKMVEGRIKKYIKEITLLGQSFVKDPEQSIEKILKSAEAKVISFVRYEVGEGIEKRSDNFAEEVMSQAKGD
ncbi:MAG: elongation factor Ts [Legionellales bacterium]|nr:elongation factor Ts [Legionellales bacterium]|tara:strand:- start:17 stop:886 length:870 start_codon:yes stop_codon:yes gene_type:complete